MDQQAPCPKKIIRRRIVPITCHIKSKDSYLTFEKKLPFTSTKVVGILTTVSSQLTSEDNNQGDVWEEGEVYVFEFGDYVGL